MRNRERKIANSIKLNSGFLSILAIFLFLIISSFAHCEYSFISNSRFVSIYGSHQTPESTLELRQLLDRGIDEIQMQTGVYLEGGPDIYIVADEKGYKQLTQDHQEIVEFSDAFYSSSQKRVYIRPLESLSGNYIKILIHEYMHWYLDQLFVGATLWFHEGMACLFANQLSLESYVSFTRDCLLHQPPDLFKMGYQYPQNPAQWQSYYIASLFAVSYLKDKQAEGWKLFWALVASNIKEDKKTPFIPAFNYSFATTLLDFNLQYQAHLKQKAWQYLIIGFNSIIFAILPFLLFFIHLKRRKRMKNLPDLALIQDAEEQEPQEDG